MREQKYYPAKIINSGQRKIVDGSAYNKYFPLPEDRDRIIIKNGEVEDTVRLMEKVVWKYISDTKQIAPLLKRNSLDATCKAIWEFIYNHVQYALDKQGLEQLRRPARSWADRNSGVDCDCMSIFISSILCNLQILHSFRITKYAADHWQHVYIIVPNGNKNLIIDAVLSQYNYEKPYSDKKDYAMSLKGINVAVLSGVSGNDLTDAIFANSLNGLGDSSEKQDLDKLYQHLVSTRNAVATNPSLVASVDDATALLKMLDYAIEYWYTDKRNEALDVLEKNEAKLNLRNGFSLNGEDENDDSLSGGKKKGFFAAIKKAANDVGSGVKAATKLIIRFNPLTIAARNGFLIAMKLNIAKMASNLKWGYATKEEAAAKKISEHKWMNAHNALVQVENLFSDKLQGKKSALKNAILKGKAGNLNGVVEFDDDGLGDPASGSAVSAAMAIIMKVVAIIKKSGAASSHENVDANSIAQEFANSPDAASVTKETQAENQSDDESGSNSRAVSKTSNSSGSNSDSVSTSNKILGFVKANPIPTALGAGLLAFGIYKVVKPKEHKNGAALSGHKKTAGKTHHPKKKKKHAVHANKLPIKTHKLL